MSIDVLAKMMAIGVGATLLMDGWNLLLTRAFGIASLNYCLLGRWLGHMPEGTFRHRSIATAAQRPRECTHGWIAHYSIGIAFAVAFVLVVSSDWLAHPTVLPALLFGLVTVVFPFFLLQPALGLGVASARAAKPAVFGLGLSLAALMVRFVVG